MLHRNKAPNLGRWNGVGGHIEPQESPYQACLREIQEETGFQVTSAHFGGIFLWHGDDLPFGGMYLFTASVPESNYRDSEEGKLDWKSVDWVLTASEVVSNIPVFLPSLLAKEKPVQYNFTYHNDRYIDYCVESLPEWVSIHSIAE